MKNFRNPWWLLLVSTLPVAVLFWIFWGTYDLIESQLSEKSIRDWLWLGIALATLWLAHSGYALFMIVKKKKLGLTYALVAFGLYVPFLYLYSMTYNSIIPAHIPGWMIADNLMLYAGTFIMPTLLHSLFIVAVVLTPEGSRRKAWPSFVFALLMPLGWYVIFQVILPLWKVVPHEFEYHAIIIVTITFVILLIFFLLRGVYVLSAKKEGFLYQYRLLGRVVVAVFFPVAGLVVNSSKLFDCIFGNFNDPWFYIIAIANGIAVIMPERDDKKYRLVLFIARSITFSYIVYFFLVFLPYLPLSILAIIAFGLGFLMLTPLVLFVLQVNMMVNDFVFLFRHYQKRYVYAMFAACFAVLPLAVSINYLWDRVMLRSALAFVYQPSSDRNSQPAISAGTVSRIIGNVHLHRRSTGWVDDNRVPFLSSYYNWIVLDNLTLSNEKLDKLASVFEGRKEDDPLATPTRLVTNPGDHIVISDAKVESAYNTDKQCWISQVHLALANESQYDAQEYVTEFHLPPGAWIDDYYLWIGDEKVSGLLAERRAATWVYQNITSYRQDPGIMYYLDPETVALRVFPFGSLEKRKTGFQVMHKEPFALALGDQILQLGTAADVIQRPLLSYDSNAVYLSAVAKRGLPKVQREPVYHFIVDASADSEALLSAYKKSIEVFTRNLDLPVHRVKVTVGNAISRDVAESDDILNAQVAGGFFLERAIERILLRYETDAQLYPIIVAVTDRFDRAILPDNFLHLKHTFAEADIFFELTSAGVLRAHSYARHAAQQTDAAWGTRNNYGVVAWPDRLQPKALLRLDNQPDIVLKEATPAVVTTKFAPHDWGAALTLEGLRLSANRYPERAVLSEKKLTKHAFETGVMLPNTSLIALENDAQRKALLKKQQDLLDGNANLDASDDIRNMSEPGFWWIAAVVLLLAMKRKMPLGLSGIWMLLRNYSFSRKG